ncbi:MAG TPA: glycosyltransferase family 4 protein [Acholeplasmataceae bacterium]|jgi:glycosyltransferase involved in cell wall biosynthesis|nr:glycosyltransferase family 4 protein [Acholeplasmataceae bacterium]
MKILYVTTISNTVNAFLVPHIKMLIGMGHKVDVAFNVEQKVKPEIKEIGCVVHEVPFTRTPFSKDNIKAYRILKRIIITEKYGIVHTHTPIASAITRLACRNMRNVKVFYTAHGFHFYKGAPLINWLIYYPVERWLARYTDVLITINQEDYERAKNKFKARKVEFVLGVGVDVEKYSDFKINRALKRKEIGVPEESFVLLSVGELNKNKNHEAVIKALAEVGNKDIHYIICGEGRLEEYLNNLSKSLGIENQVHLLGFRKDVIEITKVSDVFVLPSYREGLSLALMEAMACGLPVICSDIRGNSDLITDSKGGYLVKPNDKKKLALFINELFNQERTRKDFALYNLIKIEKYCINNVLNRLKHIYKDEIDD